LSQSNQPGHRPGNAAGVIRDRYILSATLFAVPARASLGRDDASRDPWVLLTARDMACAFPGRRREKQRGGNRALFNPRSSNRSKHGAKPSREDEESVAARAPARK